MRIAVTDGIDPNAKLSLESLGHSVIERHYSNDELISGCISDFDIVIIRSATKLNSNIIKANAGINGKLSLIIRAGVGVDNIDLSSASDYSICVCNTPNASTNAVLPTPASPIKIALHLFFFNKISISSLISESLQEIVEDSSVINL